MLLTSNLGEIRKCELEIALLDSAYESQYKKLEENPYDLSAGKSNQKKFDQVYKNYISLLCKVAIEDWVNLTVEQAERIIIKAELEAEINDGASTIPCEAYGNAILKLDDSEYDKLYHEWMQCIREKEIEDKLRDLNSQIAAQQTSIDVNSQWLEYNFWREKCRMQDSEENLKKIWEGSLATWNSVISIHKEQMAKLKQEIIKLETPDEAMSLCDFIVKSKKKKISVQ